MKWFHKYHLFKGLLLIAGFCAYGVSKSNHIIGGEIGYSHISDNKYKFYLKMYRNCNSCEFNNGSCGDVKKLDILASRDVLGYAKNIGSIDLTLSSRKDITQLCKTTQSKCSGGPFPAGIEEWIFEGTVDFNSLSKDYCKFEVGIKLENRVNVWSGAGNDETFYNYTYIDICSGIKNNSAVINAPAFSNVALNQSFTYNLLAKDNDGDSLSYALVHAEKSFITNITYPSIYNQKKPLDIYCTTGNCALDNASWPIDGMDIDAHSGWLGFTPTTSGQKGFLVMEITEWRAVKGKITKVGITRRDLQLEVIDISNNAPKISSGKLNYFACSATPFSIDISLSDQLYGTNKDSITLHSWFDLPGSSLKKVGNAKNQFDAYFSYDFTKAQARNKPYYLTITATDDHCPMQITSYKTFEINVVASPDPGFKVQHVKCNKVRCVVNLNEANTQHSWYLFDSATLINSSFEVRTDFEVTRPGKWYIVHQVINTITGCQTELKDSIIVPPYVLLYGNENWQNKACKNELLTLQASFTGGIAPFSYYWNNEAGSKIKDYYLKGDSIIHLFIQDKSGCELTIKKTIGIFKPMDIASLDTSMCMPLFAYDLPLKNRFSYNAGAFAHSLQISYAGNAGLLSKNGVQYVFKPSKPSFNTFGLKLMDSNGCNYTSNFSINVIQAVPTGISKALVTCNNNMPLNLDNQSGCQLINGQWKTTAKAGAISKNLFNSIISGAGTFKLYYSKDIGGCVVLDTTEILVNKAPLVAIEGPRKLVLCESTPDLQLTGIPGGGSWKNLATPALKNIISPTEIIKTGSNKDVVFYSYVDATNQCSSKDSVAVLINLKAHLEVPRQSAFCEGTSFLLVPKIENAIKAELIGKFDQIIPSRLGDNWKFDSKVTGLKVTYEYKVLITALEGCPNIAESFQLTVKPSPVIFGLAQPSEGCATLVSSLSAINTNQNAIASSYTWNDGNGWFKYPAQRMLNISDSGVHVYLVKAELEGCTSNEQNILVKVNPTPVAAIEVDPKTQTVTQDFPYLNFKDVSKSLVPYSRYWEIEKGFPATSKLSSFGVQFPKDTGLYKVRMEISTDKSCTSIAETYVRLRPGLQLWAPNAFTPNGKGPGQNETWHISMDSCVSFHLTVRNRWGEILYTSNNQFETWDGVAQGKEVPNGVYVWILEAKTIYGRSIERNGVVTLYR